MIPLAILLFQLLFGEIRLVTSDPLPTETASLPKPEGMYSEEALSTYVGGLQAIFDNHGYFYSDLRFNRIEVDSALALIHIDLFVSLGDPVQLRFLQLEGARRLPLSYILSQIGFQPDAVASRLELDRLRNRLHKTELFSSVSEPSLIVREGADGVLFTVVERASNYSDVMIGYADNELIGQVDLRFRHLFTPGSRFELKFDRLRSYQNSLNLAVGWKLTQLGFKLYQQDSTFFSRTLTLNSEYPVSERYFLGGWMESMTTTAGKVPPGVPVSDGTRFLTGLTLRWTSDSRDEVFVRTGTGRRSSASVQFGQLDWSITVSNIVWMGSGGVQLAESIPVDHLFRFGGATSFRGYRQQELQSTRYLWSEIEPRFGMDSASYAFVFTGIGLMPNRSALFNGGIGFTTETRLGPLRLTYAGSSNLGLLNGVIHISLSSGL